MQLYRPMLKQALSITWKFKYLWFFGLFAALMGNGGAYNLGFKNIDKVESRAVWLNDFKQIVDGWSFNFGAFDLTEMTSIFSFWGALLFLFVVILAIFLLWLAVSSQGALVYGAREALRERNNLFSEAIKKGSSRFWPILLLNIVLNLTIFIVLVLISLPFIILFLTNGGSFIWQSILVILSFLVLVPLTVILSLIMRYAVIYVVNGDRHIGGAISEALSLFRKNWIVSLETGFLLFLLNMLTGLLLVVVMVFAALPFVMLAMLAGQLASSGFLWLIVVLGVLTFIALMFLYGAAWNTFATTVWVILFEKFQAGTVYSKILRWAVTLTSGKKEEESDEQQAINETQNSKLK